MSESITLVLFIYGLAIVIAMGAALLIKLLVGALAFSERRSTAAAPPPVKAAPAPAVAVPGGIPAHHLVAIAAAAHAMVGAHRIVHIGTGGPGRLWSTEGRLAQHNAHHPH